MQLIKILITLFYFFNAVGNLSAQMKEWEYANLIQQELGGQREYAVTSGYVDLLTDDYAIEVEFANKWKQAIGQALWYGQETLNQPGIILILRKQTDYKYFLQLNTTLGYSGLSNKIKVWLYPNDFPNIKANQPSTSGKLGLIPNPSKNPNNAITPSSNTSFWLTTSSGIRHNSTCRYFAKTRGKYCPAAKGRACKKCGG